VRRCVLTRARAGQTYDGEMDFKSFLDFVLAMQHRSTQPVWGRAPQLRSATLCSVQFSSWNFRTVLRLAAFAPHELTTRYSPLWPQALHYFWRVLDLRKRGSIGVGGPARRRARRGVRDGDLAQPARTRPRGFTGRCLVPKEGPFVLRRARLS